MNSSNDEMFNEIIAQHQEYLESWVLYHADEYDGYIHSGYTYVPYGGTTVSLPEEIEIRSDMHHEALMLAAQHAWEDGRITKQGDTFIIN